MSVSGKLTDSCSSLECNTPSDLSISDDPITIVPNEINLGNDDIIIDTLTPNGSCISSPGLFSNKSNVFGKKSIGFIGGVCLLIGNMTGPGMVGIPLQYQEGGWFLTTLAFIFICVVSNISGLFLVEAISSIPYNSDFNLRIEFCILSKFYFGKYGYYISQVFINCSLQATNIASIIVGSQVMDSMLVFIFKKTCGLEIYPHPGWICVSMTSDHMSPFQDTYMLFTIGYLVILVLIIPLAFLRLEDNIIVQIGAFIVMVVVCTSWVVLFFRNGLSTENSPVFGHGKGMAMLLGNVIFNYAYITTLPSWVNETKSPENIKKTIWASSGFSTFLFIVIGLLGSFAFGNMPSNSDILSVINSSAQSNIFTRISVFIFPFAVLAASIPVFSIIVKYNLSQTKIPKWTANVIAIILPWIVVIPFMTGDRLLYISNYASLFFSSASNFIIPLLVYLQSVKFRKNGRVLNESQKQILNECGVERLILEQQEQLQQRLHPNQQDNQQQQQTPSDPSQTIPTPTPSEYQTETTIQPYITSFELEEQELIYRVFGHIDLSKCKRIAIACISILSVVILVTIFSTFIFEFAT